MKDVRKPRAVLVHTCTDCPYLRRVPIPEGEKEAPLPNGDKAGVFKSVCVCNKQYMTKEEADEEGYPSFLKKTRRRYITERELYKTGTVPEWCLLGELPQREADYVNAFHRIHNQRRELADKDRVINAKVAFIDRLYSEKRLLEEHIKTLKRQQCLLDRIWGWMKERLGVS